MEEIFGDDSKEIEVMRDFRDNVLNNTSEGQELIGLYYEWSPVIVNIMKNDKVVKLYIKEMIDEFLPMIREKQK
jgi:hypothetical protein